MTTKTYAINVDHGNGLGWVLISHAPTQERALEFVKNRESDNSGTKYQVIETITTKTKTIVYVTE